MMRALVIALLSLGAWVADAQSTTFEYLCGDITADKTLSATITYIMKCQTFVKSGITLTIDPGTLIYAMPVGPSPLAPPALIIEKGGKIDAQGTASAPITFTAFNAEAVSATSMITDTASTVSTTVLETRGKWGGIIILGNAPTSAATSKEIEGLTGLTYGGNDPTDSSGKLKYVRVWHGGASIAPDNEINGITFGGVGSGTTVENCEVAFNADDGFEFFGGTVNVKYLSALFVGDDAFDSDEGYQGKGQFLFAMTGTAGNHGTEMDSKTNDDKNSQPRSHPAFWSMTIIGGGSAATGDNKGGLLRVREGTGGSFGNVVLAYGNSIGVKNDDCGNELRTDTLPAAGTDNFLFFSPNNIIHGVSSQFNYGSGAKQCPDGNFTAKSDIPGFAGLSSTCLDYTCLTATFSPLPEESSAMCTDVDPSPNSDGWYTTVTCKGAFKSSLASDNWLAGWSWLACSGKMVGATCPGGIPPSPFDNLGESVTLLDAPITGDTTLSAVNIYVLSAQVVVETGATLTIEPGTTILAMPPTQNAVAAALVVNQGGAINAAGTAAAPITMTSILNEESMYSSQAVQTDTASSTGLVELGRRGKWGGLILLGKAPTSAATPKEIEGISGYTYGGNDPSDSSGTLQYVRVWHGGAVVGADNEINGITFGGVGSGTTVDHCEVAFNADDGFEFFGGTVNVKYLSVLFVGDDAFDSDEGYQGKGQFLFATVGLAGNHGTEMDSKTNSNIDSTPRSHPAFWSMTIIGGGGGSTRGTSNALMRLREGTGGSFGNVVLAGAHGRHVGVEFRDCGTEEHTQTLPAASSSLDTPGYLFFSPNNIVHDPSTAFTWQESSGCVAQSFAYVDADPGFTGAFYENETGLVDPRAACESFAYADIDPFPAGGFYENVGFKGAFGNINWLEGWSYLDFTNRLATYPKSCVAGKQAESGIPGWGIAVFIVLGVVLVLVVLFMCFMVKKEKSGAPIFMQIDGSGTGKKSGTEMTASGNGV